MSFTFTLVIIMAIEATITFGLWKAWKSEKKKTEELKKSLERQKDNLLALYNHALKIEKIEGAEKQTVQKLQEAKTDAEVIDIINGLVEHNNGRVPNSTKGRSRTSS